VLVAVGPPAVVEVDVVEPGDPEVLEVVDPESVDVVEPGGLVVEAGLGALVVEVELAGPVDDRPDVEVVEDGVVVVVVDVAGTKPGTGVTGWGFAAEGVLSGG